MTMPRPADVSNRRSWSTLAVRLVATVLGAFLFVCVVVLLIMYSDDHHFSGKRLLMMTIFTVVVFPTTVREFRRSSNNWRFWLAVGALFALHVAAYVVAWRTMAVEWPAITYAVVTLAEIPVLWMVLDLLGFARSRRQA